jgi:hypothetical protein
MQVWQLGSNGAEFWGLGGFPFDGLAIVSYIFMESGEQPRRVAKFCRVNL